MVTLPTTKAFIQNKCDLKKCNSYTTYPEKASKQYLSPLNEKRNCDHFLKYMYSLKHQGKTKVSAFYIDLWFPSSLTAKL